MVKIMAVTITQQLPLQQDEQIVQQTQKISDFDEIKTFLDLLRDFKIPESTTARQKVVSLSSLRSDILKNPNPRFISN
jgi:hypothetical protein